MAFTIIVNARNNVIKVQSRRHNQLSAPRYANLFSCFKSGYTNICMLAYPPSVTFLKPLIYPQRLIGDTEATIPSA